jgi:hypothetical protein
LVNHCANDADPLEARRVPLEDEGDDGRLDGMGDKEALVLVALVAVGNLADGPFATGGLAFHPGDDALDDRRALELGKDAEHLHHHPPRRARRIERLGRRPEPDPGVVEAFEDLRETTHRPREPVNAVDEQQVKAPGLGLQEGTFEVRAFERGAGHLIGEAPHDLPALLAVRVRREPIGLRFQRVRLVLLVG